MASDGEPATKSLVNQVTSQGLTIAGHAVPGADEIVFVRITLRNGSEDTIAGRIETLLEQRMYGPGGENATHKGSFAFSLASGDSDQFEFLCDSRRLSYVEVKAYLANAKVSETLKLELSSGSHGGAWAKLGVSSIGKEPGFLSDDSSGLRTLPERANTLRIWNGLSVNLRETVRDADLELLRAAADLGVDLHLQVDPESAESLRMLAEILGREFTKEQLGRDIRVYTGYTEYLTTSGSFSGYLSGMSDPRRLFDFAQRTSMRDALSLTDSVIYSLASSRVIVSLGEVEIDDELRSLLLRSTSREANDRGYRRRGSSFHGTHFVTVGSQRMMPYSFLLTVVLASALAFALVPIFVFREKRPQWLVVGIAIVAIGLSLALVVSRSIASANAPRAIEFHVLTADNEGNFVKCTSGVQLRSLPEGVGPEFSNEDVFFFQHAKSGRESIDYQHKRNSMAFENLSLEADVERSLVVLRLVPKSLALSKIMVEIEGERVTNSGDLAIRCGILELGNGNLAFIPAIGPGESAAVELLRNDGEEAQAKFLQAGLEGYQARYFTDYQRLAALSDLLHRGFATLVIDEPEGLSTLEGLNERESLTVVRVPMPVSSR